MHFLRKVIESPILEDPANKYKSVHRHFYRYSKGEFIGPAMKISKTQTKITLKGSHEYEDLILELVVNSISNPNQLFEIKGKLISGVDISDTISKLGYNWNLKKSTGQTKNFKANIVDQTNQVKLLESIKAFRENSYFLISLNLNPECKITTKKSIPQPSKKKIGDDDVNTRIKFCTGYISNTEKNLETILNFCVPDFKSELPGNWKSIIVFNNYKIEDIDMPKNIKNSRLLRIMAIRKGKLLRSIEVNGEIIEKQYNIVV